MSSATSVKIRQCVDRLRVGYLRAYKDLKPEYAQLLSQVATKTLAAISHTDAPYHDIEHTILITLVGQEMLRGKHMLEGSVTYKDWLHFIVASLCHDIGYVRGICRQDQANKHAFTTGIGNDMVELKSNSTDASLAPYHIDRGKRFVQENFAHHPLLDIEIIQHNIEITRFPAPDREVYRDTVNYPGLTRAADLIGQLSDPHYLQKIPALFQEFEEIGSHKSLGYQNPKDMRAGYPKFYRTVVSPLIQNGIRYLELTPFGQQIVKSLATHVSTVEQEQIKTTASASNVIDLSDVRSNHFCWKVSCK
jgi:hypothetical protein